MRVGIAGIGFMGWIHWLAWNQVPGARVTAICSRSAQRRSGDWTGIQGNFGPPGETVDLTGINAHATIEKLVEDTDVDLVDLCLPPGVHASSAIAALESGKHVLCEKPMALSLAECDEMLAAASSARRHLLVAHVLPFFPEYAFARAAVAGQHYGELLGGHFLRTVSDPTWVDGYFDRQVVGGPLIDLLIHDLHFVRAILGMPDQVCAAGRLRDELVEFATAQFRFAGGATAICSGGVINQQGRPFTHGFEMHFEQATLQFQFAACADAAELMPLKVLEADGSVTRPELAGGDPVLAFVEELKEVCQVVTGEQESSNVLDGRLARDALALTEAVSRSVLSGDSIDLRALAIAKR